ncbi:hypothetical protein P168DRAFT_253187 [Aspergillus campestris IBT 28561]|uniref:Ferric oxidoreductase domain-containing protein n=1 Tax=Aspergillus campestris (strain IBT 28561) TaxID=1392248 RepID=A0A2I1D302_ASPC2|nr:uncharacterized protein P168DRAFT_253187 [Aspergillus campestris IBT 28561]PKY04256.1 hypothetical protein P168DRAFT_253187 [Aspergillus campestris IBT 28561]
MSFPWHFVSVSTEAKQHRRELLDLRGYYAQISVVLAIVSIRLYNLRRKPAVLRSWWDAPPFPGWRETRRQYAVCLVWLGWLVGLSAWNTGDDYLHLTKALGHIALSQLPVQALMSPALYPEASKAASPSLMAVMTGLPQPSITPIHRLFGRIVIAPLLTAHAALYLNFFSQSAHPEFGTLLAKRLLDEDVQWGIAGLTMLGAVLVFVRPVGRTTRWWLSFSPGWSVQTRREVFYTVHVLVVGMFCGAAYWHVEWARGFVLQTLGCAVVNYVCCSVLAR